jgi:hypothetical protein
MSGIRAGSAALGSPGQIHTNRSRSTTGNDVTEALGLMVSCDGMKVQRPRGS